MSICKCTRLTLLNRQLIELYNQTQQWKVTYLVEP